MNFKLVMKRCNLWIDLKYILFITFNLEMALCVLNKCRSKCIFYYIMNAQK